MSNLPLKYRPQPKQRVLHTSAANEILFGGAAGPGKSMALRHEAIFWCTRIPGLHVYLFRRTYPELESNHIVPLMEQVPGETGARYNKALHRWEWPNGAMLHLCHCQRELDRFLYQGAEIHVLIIDELTTFTEAIYTYLRGRVRCTLPVPEQFRHKVPGIYCASNPGGVGHEWVKRYWIDGREALKLYHMPGDEGGMVRQYVPALLADNPILMREDPDYVDRLDGLPEPYRTAYKTGDWEIFIGQAFGFNRKDHVIDPMPVPTSAPLMMTFDYGFGAPFSVGYWWTDPDNRLYRWGEIYGRAPGYADPNTGLRLSHDEIAERIVQWEKDEGIWNERGRILRLSDPTCFNKTPDARGGGQGPSTAEDFARHDIVIRPGDPSRKHGIRQFHQRLRVVRDAQGNRTALPMLVVYPRCEDFIRTIPLLNPSPTDPEDIDTRQEDHAYDDAKLACMARPLDGWALSGSLAPGATSPGLVKRALKAGAVR